MSDIEARLVACMSAAVAALPWAEQRVFVLHAVDDLDYAAIAERLVITVPEVESLLASALVLLAQNLAETGPEEPPLGNGA